MHLSVEIKDENIVDKIVKLLEVFKDDGVKVIYDKAQEEWNDGYIENNWREIGMSTHSANIDDNEVKYDAYARFNHDKHSS